jgi:AAA+ ATPase superfamily predicted ATPase
MIKKFEAFDPGIEMEEDIENILLDIEDEGYETSVKVIENKNLRHLFETERSLVVTISKYSDYSDDPIMLDEISDTIIHLYDYMKKHQSFYKRNPDKVLIRKKGETASEIVGWGQPDKRNLDAYNSLKKKKFHSIQIVWIK